MADSPATATSTDTSVPAVNQLLRQLQHPTYSWLKNSELFDTESAHVTHTDILLATHAEKSMRAPQSPPWKDAAVWLRLVRILSPDMFCSAHIQKDFDYSNAQRHHAVLEALRIIERWRPHTLPFSILFVLFRNDYHWNPQFGPPPSYQIVHSSTPISRAVIAHWGPHRNRSDHTLESLADVDIAQYIDSNGTPSPAPNAKSSRSPLQIKRFKYFASRVFAVDHVAALAVEFNCLMLLNSLKLCDDHFHWKPTDDATHVHLVTHALRFSQPEILAWALKPYHRPAKYIRLWTFDAVFIHGVDCIRPDAIWSMRPTVIHPADKSNQTLWNRLPAFSDVEKCLFLVGTIDHDNLLLLRYLLAHTTDDSWRRLISRDEETNRMVWSRVISSRAHGCFQLLYKLFEKKCLQFPFHRNMLSQCILRRDTWGTEFLAKCGMYLPSDLPGICQAVAQHLNPDYTALSDSDRVGTLVTLFHALAIHEHRARLPGRPRPGPDDDPTNARKYLTALAAIPNCGRILRPMWAQNLLPTFDPPAILALAANPHIDTSLLHVVLPKPSADINPDPYHDVRVHIAYDCVAKGRIRMLKDILRANQSNQHLEPCWGTSTQQRVLGAPAMAAAAARGDITMLRFVQSTGWLRWSDIDCLPAILANQVACVELLVRQGARIYFSFLVELVRTTLRNIDATPAGPSTSVVVHFPKATDIDQAFAWPMLSVCLLAATNCNLQYHPADVLSIQSQTHIRRKRSHRTRMHVDWTQQFHMLCSQTLSTLTHLRQKQRIDYAIVCEWSRAKLPLPPLIHEFLAHTTLCTTARRMCLKLWRAQYADTAPPTRTKRRRTNTAAPAVTPPPATATTPTPEDKDDEWNDRSLTDTHSNDDAPLEDESDLLTDPDALLSTLLDDWFSDSGHGDTSGCTSPTNVSAVPVIVESDICAAFCAAEQAAATITVA